MDISNIAFRLIIILMPGIIATLLVKNFTISKKWDSFKFSVNTLLFSGITYMILQIIANILLSAKCALRNTAYNSTELQIWNQVSNEGAIPMSEVFFACILSIIVGLTATYIIQNKKLFDLTNRLKISNKFGDENLFYEFFRNSETEAIYLRDPDNNITYHGFVESFSESEIIREICLTEVDVYSYEDSKLCYSTPKIYLSKKIDENWIIEIPKITNNEQK